VSDEEKKVGPGLVMRRANIDIFRDRLKTERHNLQVALDLADMKVRAVEALDKLPLALRAELAADLADYYDDALDEPTPKSPPKKEAP